MRASNLKNCPETLAQQIKRMPPGWARFIELAEMILAGAAIATLASRWPEKSLLLAGGLAALLIACIKPRAIMTIIILWLTFQYLPTKTWPVLPESAVWLDDALLGILTLVWIGRRLLTHHPFHPTIRDWLLAGFLLIAGISSLVNAIPLPIALQGIRGIVQPILMYYAVVNFRFSQKTLRFWVYLVIGTGLVQLPYTLYEGFTQGRWWGDVVTGTFGFEQGTGFGHWLSLLVLLVLGLLLLDRARARYWVALGILLIPLILASSRISYFVIPAIIAWLLRQQLVKRPRVFLSVALILAALFVGLYFSYSLSNQHTFSGNLSPSFILFSQLTPSYGGRLVWYEITWAMIAQNATSLLVGFGPGAFSSFTAERNQTPLFVLIDQIRAERGFAIYPASGFIAVPGEFGLVGLALYLGLLLATYKAVARWLDKTETPFWKGVTFGVKGATIYFLFAGLTLNSWETMFFAGYFWLLVGIVRQANKHTLSNTTIKQAG